MRINVQIKTYIFWFLLFALCPILSLISYASDQPVFVLENNDPIVSINFSPDGSKLITGWGKCIIWDMNSGQQVRIINTTGASCVAFSPDCKMVATGTDPNLSGIWDAETGEKITKFNYKHVPGTGPIVLSAIVFHPREPYVITSTSDGDLSKWNINTGDEIPLISLGSLIDRIQVFSDGDRIATYMDIISLRNNSILHEFDTRIQISSDEQSVFCRSAFIDGNFSNKQISFFNANDYNLVKKFPVFISNSNNALFSPDGSLMLLYEFNDNNGPLQLMRVENNEIVNHLKVKGKDNLVIRKAIFSPDGKKLAVASENTAYIWDISDLYSSVPQSTNLKQ